MSEKTRSYERIPYLIFYQDKSPFKETYAGPLDFGALKSHHLKPAEPKSNNVILFMHPIGGGEYLPMVVALAKAGYPVIYCQSRYSGNDSALIMEKVAIDMGNCIRHAKEQLGYDKVILAAWSGGGSLSLFYQSQAENPTITHTPAGDRVDLTIQDLIPADGVMVLAAHVSRAHTLTEWMDASIMDESDPEQRDPELDLYNPANPNQPPYSEAFLTRYREAQVARNRRITQWVKDKLADFKAKDRPNEEFGFVVHGTMADPRWLDPSVDPNDRQANWCYLGDPQVVNNGPVGLARFCTLRSWLSQWSYDDSNADGVACAGKISVPIMVVGNSADDACTPSHTHRLYNAISHDDREMHEIQGATHYYFGQPEQLQEAVELCASWLQRKGFA
ncbi:alpha/beta fold hydrolase [Spongiibacter nanhainus]|uniref:Alpha/beta fold hydrolase n=1 Tax=Spongiibacter nanhainus TaxID=2794344 RepID=A0A7T4R086_9GAMM|nr:alpha/beta fold hydrolase [Spongiibacter nanhainus]QQD17929.1 alpha/beta fold hydrolase [Spongiibacter nanhainus]